MRVLDYGAGKLRNSIYLSDEGFKVYACDTLEQIDKVNSPLIIAKLEGLISEEKLSDFDLNVDLVLSSYVLNIIEYKEDKIKYLRNSYSNLNNNGYLLLEVRRRTEMTSSNCKTALNINDLDGLVSSEGFSKINSLSADKYLSVLYRKKNNRIC